MTIALPLKLRAHVEALTCLGERSTAQPEAMAAAASWLKGELAGYGYKVRDQEFLADEVVCRNIEAVAPGFSRARRHLLIGAHYDSAPGTPGADDNASAVAILLALAERFAGHPSRKRLRFVAFANEEPPHFLCRTMGSFVFARDCARGGDRIALMLCLESLGVFFDAPGTQRLPFEIPAHLLPTGMDPSVGNFAAIVGNADSLDDAGRFAAGFTGLVPAIPIELPTMELSDHVSFWNEGIPAIMVTDTAPFRNRHYHLPTDTPEKLDYVRMADVLESLVRGVEAWLD